MSLEQTLTTASQEALKARDARKREILTTLLAEVKKARIDAAGKPFGPTEELSVLEKAKKTREESLTMFEQAGRAELVERVKEEITVIRSYLPEPLSEDDVKKIVADAVAEVGATSIKDMGKVMGIVQPHTKGRFDAAKVATLVKAALGA